MIRTRPLPPPEVLAAIPVGEPVGILGCGDCAAVFGTGGTRQVEDWEKRFAGRNPVVFATVAEAPCDQRVLKRLLKFIGGFPQARSILVLACPAGVQSLASLIQGEAQPPRLIPGLTAEGLSWIGGRGAHQTACIFCDTCTYQPVAGACPVATCPLYRADGPCQNRLAEDLCPLLPSTRCTWIQPPQPTAMDRPGA